MKVKTEFFFKDLENIEASYGMMPLAVEINVAVRKQICQKIGSERVKKEILLNFLVGSHFSEVSREEYAWKCDNSNLYTDDILTGSVDKSIFIM